MLTARVVDAPRQKPRVMGEVTEEHWTTVAAERDGVVQHEQIGKQTTTRRAYFAFRAEAERWLRQQAVEGFVSTGISSAATVYFGPTDAPGNCWSASCERVES